jgi:hypothetical protein
MISEKHSLKGIGSILFLKNGLKNICRKNYKNNLRSNNYEVCTAVPRCSLNILDVIGLGNIKNVLRQNMATAMMV